MNSRRDLKICSRKREGVTILDLQDRLILGQESTILREYLLNLLSSDTKELILNFKAVSAVDSAALGSLLFCALKYKKAGGKLTLLNLQSRCATLSDILKANLRLDVYRDEMDAVNSFFPERAFVHYDILEFIGKRNPVSSRVAWSPAFACVA